MLRLDGGSEDGERERHITAHNSSVRHAHLPFQPLSYDTLAISEKDIDQDDIWKNPAKQGLMV